MIVLVEREAVKITKGISKYLCKLAIPVKYGKFTLKLYSNILIEQDMVH